MEKGGNEISSRGFEKFENATPTTFQYCFTAENQIQNKKWNNGTSCDPCDGAMDLWKRRPLIISNI
jgi:hypothetical protein